MKRDQGFTLVELLVSTSLAICIVAAILAAVYPAESMFGVISEAADMQQRLRVATTVLFNDLLIAGAGTDVGASAGPLSGAIPPIMPYRHARTAGDPPGIFRSDAITLLHVRSRSQTTIAGDMPARSGSVAVNSGVGCPLIDAACGLSAARMALIIGADGSFDRYRIDDVQGSRLWLYHPTIDSDKTYPAGSQIVEASVRIYFLRADPASDVYQLMRDAGDGYPAAPVVDHVVQIGFEYFGDPHPPVRPDSPQPGRQRMSYPPGENCVVVRDAHGNAAPRLPVLEPANDGDLVALSASELTDGPWCPDETAVNRFDADLLRIRRVAVALRIESAIAALRGPAGPLFFRGGTSTGGARFLPDQTIRFQVSPRNLNHPRRGSDR
jgi:hypothetical protein